MSEPVIVLMVVMCFLFGMMLGIRLSEPVTKERCADAAIKDDPPAWWERAKIMAEARAKAANLKEGE